MNDFLHSKSMITPGLAGGLVMVIANAVSAQFKMESHIPFLVLGLSFLIGMVVFNDNSVTGTIKPVFYVVNSLIIFAMATGTNTIGNAAGGRALEVREEMEEVVPIIEPIGAGHRGHVNAPFMLAVYVQTDDSVSATNAGRKRLLKEQVAALSNNIQLVQSDLVNNQRSYADPKAELDRLNAVNDQLVRVHKVLKEDSAVTDERHLVYLQRISEVQEDLRKFQENLLRKKRQPVQQQQMQQRQFFKSWF